MAGFANYCPEKMKVMECVYLFVCTWHYDQGFKQNSFCLLNQQNSVLLMEITLSKHKL